MLSFTAKTSPERSLPCVCGLARTAQCPCLSVSQLHQCIFHAFLHFFSISAGLGGPRSPGFDGRPAQLFAILCGEIGQPFHLVLFVPIQVALLLLVICASVSSEEGRVGQVLVRTG